MKTLKAFKVVLVILVLIILGGCSDQITSPSDHTTNPGSTGIPKDKVSEADDQVSSNYFNTRIKLGPNREYTFNVSNTGLAKFTAIDVERISNEMGDDLIAKNCRYLQIYGDGAKFDIALSCSSKGFDVKQIRLKNLSSRILDLNISLLGVKKAKNINSEW